MNKKEQILKLVAEYIQEKHAKKTWKAGEDWVQYSGPYFDSSEYVSAINTLLNEWLVLGEDAIKFEKRFPPLLGKTHGVVVNSGSSANLLMMEAIASKNIFTVPSYCEESYKNILPYGSSMYVVDVVPPATLPISICVSVAVIVPLWIIINLAA